MTRSNIGLFLLIFSLLSMTTVDAGSFKNNVISSQSHALTNTRKNLQQSQFAPHQLIVRYKKNQSISTLLLKTQLLSSGSKSLGTIKNSEAISLVSIQENIDLNNAIERFKADPNVVAVSYDYYNEFYYTPNDALYIAPPQVMWGLKDTAPDLTQAGILPDGSRFPPNSNDTTSGNDISAEKAWDIWQNKVTAADKSAIIIAVIDSGIDYTHPDLRAAMWNGINATVDGVASPTENYGRNVADAINDPYPANNYHGTHVAGTIAASGDNAIGIIGVAYGAKLMAIKVDSNLEGQIMDSSIIAGINYAVENGAAIINMSLGHRGKESRVLTSVIEDMANAGVLLVAAAGNSALDNDIEQAWPANYATLPSTQAAVISVAASDQADQLAKFSNFGRNSVSIAAPGVNINSTISGQQTLAENDIDGAALPLKSGTGIADPNTSKVSYPFCRDALTTCFDNTFFANSDPSLPDCSGTKCQWGWGRDMNRNKPILYLVGDDNMVFTRNPDKSIKSKNYTNNLDATITSQVFTNQFNQKTLLSYDAIWDLECGDGNADYVDVEVFDGTRWILLKGKNSLNRTLPNSPKPNCQTNHTFTGHMGRFVRGFVKIRHDISAYANPKLQVRFRFVTNASVNDSVVSFGFQLVNLEIITQVSDYSNSYTFLKGTSMAAPHVAGIAALIKGVYPKLTGSHIKTILVNSGDTISTLSNKTRLSSRANAFNAINKPLVAVAPLLSAIGDHAIKIGDTINILISAVDLNGETPIISISGTATGATLTLSNPNDGTALFSWTPSLSDLGDSKITFTADDLDATTALTSETITLSVSQNTNTTSSSSSAASSGGCAMSLHTRFDPVFLFLILLFFIQIIRKNNSHLLAD